MSDGPGFIFWGLFVVFGLVVAGYVAWMLWHESREHGRSTGSPGSDLRRDGGPGGDDASGAPRSP
ncbi:MAG TPA: hypothetical protein VMT85_13810 [Thermoanaerobaculia bacterium]|nr:hypothetical protein [Thermoanaerobaculia bacterium]